VPRGDRPRDGRYPVGQAAVRTRPPYGYYPGYYPSHYHYPYAWYGYGGFGLGYFYYDPFWWGYPGYGYNPGYGYYPGAYYGAGYYGGGYPWGGISVGGSYSGGSSGTYYGTGKLRLKVKPRDAEVYVDGYFVGLVDDYDGTFQRLELDAGPHRVEVRKPGFASMTVEVRILEGETVTYRGELRTQ
jgi:hypothetical protein